MCGSPGGVGQHELNLLAVDLPRRELFGLDAASVPHQGRHITEVVSHGVLLMMRIYGVDEAS